MKFVFVCLAAACLLTPAFAQQASQGPSNEKAQKSYKQAFQELREGQEAFAVDEFKKADKQDGGHCFACQAQMIKYDCKWELGTRPSSPAKKWWPKRKMTRNPPWHTISSPTC